MGYIVSALSALVLMFTLSRMDAKPAAQHADVAEPPRVFLLDVQLLEQVRTAIKAGDERFTPAYQQLLKDADQALQTKPQSVVEKTGPVPSGDPHDYVSIGVYWWRNPDTADGLPYVRRDGQRNPETTNDTFDAHRTHIMREAVKILVFGWYFSGNEAYAEHAATLLRTFYLNPETRMNPNLNFGQGIPGRENGRGIGLIETSSWIELVDLIGLLRGSANWTDADEAGMREWFAEYLQWMLTSKNGISCRMQSNNIGIWYDAQILSYALFTDQQELARNYYQDVALKRLSIIIEPDGRMPTELARTRSLSYTLYCLRALCSVASLGRHVGGDFAHHMTEDGRSLRKAIDFMLSYVGRTKEWPYQQISEVSDESLITQVLPLAVVWYGVEPYEQLLKNPKSLPSETNRNRLIYPQLLLKQTP